MTASWMRTPASSASDYLLSSGICAVRGIAPWQGIITSVSRTMPVPGHVQACYVCGRRGEKALCCAQCGVLPYCSRECQKIDWTRRGHRERCVPLLERAKARVGMETRFFRPLPNREATDDAPFCKAFEKLNLDDASDMWKHAQRVVQAQVAVGAIDPRIGALVREAQAVHDEQGERMLKMADRVRDPAAHTSDAALETSVHDAYNAARMEEIVHQIAILTGELSETAEADDAMGFVDRHLVAELAKMKMLWDEQDATGDSAEKNAGDILPLQPVVVPRLAAELLGADLTPSERRRLSMRARGRNQVPPAVRAVQGTFLSMVYRMVSDTVTALGNSAAAQWVRLVWGLIRPLILQLPIVNEWLEWWALEHYGREAEVVMEDDTRGDAIEQERVRLRNYARLAQRYPRTDIVINTLVIIVQDLALFWIGAALALLFDHIQTAVGATTWVPESNTAWTARIRSLGDDLMEYRGNLTAYRRASATFESLNLPDRPAPSDVTTALRTAQTALGACRTMLNSRYDINLQPGEILEIPDSVLQASDIERGIELAFGTAAPGSTLVGNGRAWGQRTLELFRTRFAPRGGSGIYHVGITAVVFAGFFWYGSTSFLSGVAAAAVSAPDILTTPALFLRAWFAHRVRQSAIETLSVIGNYVFGITAGSSAGTLGRNIPLSNAETMAVVVEYQQFGGNDNAAELARAEALQLGRTAASNAAQVQYLHRTGPLRIAMNIVVLAAGSYFVWQGALGLSDFFVVNTHFSLADVMSTNTTIVNLPQGYLIDVITVGTSVALQWHGAHLMTTITTTMAQRFLTSTMGGAILSLEQLLGYNFAVVLQRVALGLCIIGVVAMIPRAIGYTLRAQPRNPGTEESILNFRNMRMFAGRIYVIIRVVIIVWMFLSYAVRIAM
jgi:hypothetical protein